MPVWRPRPEWLAAAVAGALSEDAADVELIVVDDGCETPVTELLADVADPRLRVIRIDHAGASAARNAGIAQARGAWLRFVDADDVCEPGSTAHLLGLAAGPRTIAYGATVMCDETLEPRWTMTSRVQGDAARACLLGGFTVRLAALLFPRDVVDAAGRWDATLALSEDWDFILRALEHAPVRGDRTATFRYRRHPWGATADVARSAEAIRRVHAGYFARHPEQRDGALARRARASADAILARVEATHGRAGRGLAHLARALARDPRAIGPEARLIAQVWASRSR